MIRACISRSRSVGIVLDLKKEEVTHIQTVGYVGTRMNLSQELDKLLESLVISYSSEDLPKDLGNLKKYRNIQWYEEIDQAKAKLLKLIHKACIKELERLHRFEGEGLPDRDYDNVTDELIDERIAELKKEKK